jgi:hypothetical protein
MHQPRQATVLVLVELPLLLLATTMIVTTTALMTMMTVMTTPARREWAKPKAN